jgi:hypothetical protein
LGLSEHLLMHSGELGGAVKCPKVCWAAYFLA